MEASVRTRQIDSTTYRIALAGEFDRYTSPEFRPDLHTCLEHGPKSSSRGRGACDMRGAKTQEVLKPWQPAP